MKAQLRRQTSHTPRAATTATTSAKVQQTSPLSSVTGTQALKTVSQQYLNELQERPKLIAALSDSHKDVSRLMLANVLLRKVVRSMLSIKKIIQSNTFTPELMNQIDIDKKAIMDAVNTQLFGDYVLDSSFAPIAEMDQGIEFTIAGLDLTRERLTNELVTLYINNNMVPLGFDRIERDQVLFEQFSLMFAYSNMRLRLGEQKKFIISLPDTSWRRWDMNVHISGQGGRYSEGT
ncbi:MAG: hypothetical protein ACK5NC_07915, partial [Vibrio sp.]